MTTQPVVTVEKPNVGTKCPHCAEFVAVIPTVFIGGSVPAEGQCPNCGKTIQLR